MTKRQITDCLDFEYYPPVGKAKAGKWAQKE